MRCFRAATTRLMTYFRRLLLPKVVQKCLVLLLNTFPQTHPKQLHEADRSAAVGCGLLCVYVQVFNTLLRRLLLPFYLRNVDPRSGNSKGSWTLSAKADLVIVYSKDSLDHCGKYSGSFTSVVLGAVEQVAGWVLKGCAATQELSSTKPNVMASLN